MDKEILRIKRLAGILTEGVMAVPGIGEQSESEMQTQSTAAVNQGDADFDISQGGLEEGGYIGRITGPAVGQRVIIDTSRLDRMYGFGDQTKGIITRIKPSGKMFWAKVSNGQEESQWEFHVDDIIEQGVAEGIDEVEEAVRVFHKGSRADRAAVEANPELQQDRDAAAAAMKKFRSTSKYPAGTHHSDLPRDLRIHKNTSVAREDIMADDNQTCNECGSVMYEGHACGSDSMEEARKSKKPERFDATELAAAWGGHQVPEPGKEPGTVSVQHKTPSFSDTEDDENDEVKEGVWDTVKDISRRAANVIAPDDETLLRDLQRRAGIEPKDPHVHAKQLARDNPEDPADNFIKGGQDLGIFKETEESLDEAYMSAEQAEDVVLEYERMGLFDIEHQDDVLRGLSDSQLDELKTALSILIREYDLVPSLSEKYLQAYRNIEYYLGDRKSLRGLNESQELSEKKMKAKHKTKEKKLKKKYDKSGMKKSMMKQYGKEKGKQVYFAKIRGEAMKESSKFDQVFNLDDLDITIAESLYALDEAYDLNNGYEDRHYAVGDDYFPDGADSPVVDEVGPSGARQGDNPEQKKMQVATESVHRELVYEYRKFLKESS